ncbi:hypothetical protein PybrP1_009014 [[Pythium] brassicae (nom. inval.)]|nr:hypothetical protein PybrP1_009014 [[Pythium] brassicae (nom. inval.)]
MRFASSRPSQSKREWWSVKYLGELRFVDPMRQKRDRNHGYAFMMRATPASGGKRRVLIDAERYGSLTRFANHACNPSAHFNELTNDKRHAVVVVTCRAVEAGDELTVSYGTDLWFTAIAVSAASEIATELEAFASPILHRYRVPPSQVTNSSTADDAERARFPSLRAASDRLGGDDVGTEETTSTPISFTKAKRLRAELAARNMKQQLMSIEAVASRGSPELMQVMMFTRDEVDRKADARREEAVQRRQAELLKKEERRRAEREERENKRRIDKEEGGERRRQDKEDARARAQEMLLLISALTKK